MGRTRGFDEAQVLRAAAATFVRGGYEATSVDDLVTALGVHRGSLYHAFGSKRGLFLAALDRHVESEILPLCDLDTDGARAALRDTDVLDLVLVAAIERGSTDIAVAVSVRRALDLIDKATGAGPDEAAQLLGTRLAARLVT